MSIIGRLFGKPGSTPTLTRQQSAALKEMRRNARIKPLPIHDCELKLTDPAIAAGQRVANISIAGMGLLRTAELDVLKPGAKLKGSLNFGGTRVDFEARLVHLSEDMAGCLFPEGQDDLKNAVLRFFDVELAAASMIEVNPEMLQKVADGTPHWLHGSNDTEVYLIVEAERIVRFHLSLRGNYLEGGEGKQAIFGKVDRDFDYSKPSYKGADLVRWEALDPARIPPLIRFVSNIRQLTEAQRKRLIVMIEEAKAKPA